MVLLPGGRPDAIADCLSSSACVYRNNRLDTSGLQHILHAERGTPDPAARAPVAQLDRAPDYESGGREFESSPVRHKINNLEE